MKVYVVTYNEYVNDTEDVCTDVEVLNDYDAAEAVFLAHVDRVFAETHKGMHPDEDERAEALSHFVSTHVTGDVFNYFDIVDPDTRRVYAAEIHEEELKMD